MNKCFSNKIDVIAIVGPTASGKTAYAIDLAEKINGEIISADSRLVYKGFDIGTAKPTEQERRGIPHYLIDVAEPEVEYSAGLYKKQAGKIIEDIAGRGKKPIIAGGTGLYIDILLKNFDLPKVVPDNKLRSELSLLNQDTLYEMLECKDPESASVIERNDVKKIIRALEIIISTGKTLSQARGINSDPQYNVEWIGCNFPRNELYERINKRVDLMFEQGLIEETQNLLYKHGKIYNLVNTIGYREVIRYLDGELTQDECSELLKQNTRKYAKRQLTWFRRNENIKWNVYPEKLKK